jgi:hypothetical protein
MCMMPEALYPMKPIAQKMMRMIATVYSKFDIYL